MKIQIDTQSYNEKRYGRPWIANVTFTSASKADFQFGEWCGTPGCSGLLEIETEPGSVIAVGQKDFRKQANSAPRFFVVPAEISGTVESERTSALEEAGFNQISKKDAYLLLNP